MRLNASEKNPACVAIGSSLGRTVGSVCVWLMAVPGFPAADRSVEHCNSFRQVTRILHDTFPEKFHERSCQDFGKGFRKGFRTERVRSHRGHSDLVLAPDQSFFVV